MSQYHRSKIWRQFKMSDNQNALLALAAFTIIRSRRRRREAEKQPRLWVRAWLGRGDELGFYSTLMSELENENVAGYVSFQRLHPDLFQELLYKIEPYITKKNTNMRVAIPAGVRLAITLCYLATGLTYMSASFEFRVAPNTIGTIVPEVYDALYHVLKDEYFKSPKSSEDWLAIAKLFEEKWQFPHCIGALDGKHIVIRPPPNSGTLFFNYKKTFSIVMMALVDADYKFIFVDVGANGCVSDGGVFTETALGKALTSGSFQLPAPATLCGDDEPMPYMIVGDDAFPLKTNLMKPYPYRNMDISQRIFNYRLSRARHVSENAFGILANRWCVFLSPILLAPDRVEKIVLATCALHNLLRVRRPATTQHLLDREDPETHNLELGDWRNEATIEAMHRMRGNNINQPAKAQRDYLKDYFSSDAGSVPWQEHMIHNS